MDLPRKAEALRPSQRTTGTKTLRTPRRTQNTMMSAYDGNGFHIQLFRFVIELLFDIP